MPILRTWKLSDKRSIEQLITRSFFDRRIERRVQKIIEEVEKRGDDAVRSYSARFDHVSVRPGEFRVTKKDMARARRHAEKEFVSVFRQIQRNIFAYHRRQKPCDSRMHPGDRSTLSERWLPLKRVGVYVPGGKSPLVSTVLMGVVPAKVAGVKEIVVASPPSHSGQINPHVLAACAMLGVGEVYRVGGAQAIAAMALGTGTIPKVDKIVGPGNAYVTMAKKVLYGQVGIDIVAGPSEILIVADQTAEPAFVAADLLSQAEHGTGREVCVLVTDSLDLVKHVQMELEALAASRKKRVFGGRQLLQAITIVITKTLDESLQFANEFAAEHVEIMVRKASSVARSIKNAGAVFVGKYSPVPVGDFYAGPNHILPTGGAARFLSGLSVADFMKRISLISYTKQSLREALPAVAKMAEVEGLEGHAQALRIRFSRHPK